MLHHLIDPRTGGPVDSPWRTASVVAATCVDANTAAIAAVVMGTRAIAWLEAARLPARLVAVDGTVTRLNGWPEPADGGPPTTCLRAARGSAGQEPQRLRNRFERSPLS